jgi:hypothetical protein
MEPLFALFAMFRRSKRMASQKLANCCVAAIALVTAAYLSTPHSSTIARLAFGAFCLAIHAFCFLAKASKRIAFVKGQWYEVR